MSPNNPNSNPDMFVVPGRTENDSAPEPLAEVWSLFPEAPEIKTQDIVDRVSWDGDVVVRARQSARQGQDSDPMLANAA